MATKPFKATEYPLVKVKILPKKKIMSIWLSTSINNCVFRTLGSPLLLPKHHCIDRFPEYKGEIDLTLDHFSLQVKNIISIQCTVADEKISFARYRPFPFWNRVRDAFIGSQHLD